MAIVISVFVLSLGALALWLIWRPGPAQIRLAAWRQRLESDATLQEWVGAVHVTEPASSYFGDQPVAYTVCYAATAAWKPEEDLVRTLDQMNVWSRQTRIVPFELVTDDGARVHVALDDTSIVHVATTFLGEAVTSDDAAPLPRGKYGSPLAGYWEMSIRPGDRVKLLGTSRASAASGNYREAPTALTTVGAASLVCTPELDRPALVERATPATADGLTRLLATAFVGVMILAALTAASAV